MTIDISFGKLRTNELGEPDVDWLPPPQKADDGVDPELCIYAGHPAACLAISSFAEWLESCPAVQLFYSTCQPDHPVKLSQVLEIIKAMPDASGINGERGKWLKYWALRAQAEFGSQAFVMRS